MNRSDETTPGKLSLTSGQKQQMKKYAVFALIFVIFVLCMWLIFSPSEKEKTKANAIQGFNTNIPLPKEEGIIGDKESAYEEEQLKKKQEEKILSLQDFSAMLSGSSKDGTSSDLFLTGNRPEKNVAQPRYGSSSSKSSIQKSAAAYQDINRSLGTFYENPKEDPEKIRLAKELEEIKAKQSDSETRKNAVDEQMAIMERSYQIAAKYMPQLQGQTSEQMGIESRLPGASGKAAIVPVTQVIEQTVSSLQQETSSTDTAKSFPEPQNPGFLTVATTVQKESKNTINACVHNNQTVSEGQTVRLRLTEQMQAGAIIIPQNAIISGIARIQGERLNIIVNSLEYNGLILPVELTVYDTDGQRGIFIPSTQAMSAAKEVIANMGTSTGTNISLTSNAGQQLAADLGRSAIQGTSQYMAKKLREVKVNLKAGYKVLLLPGNK
jgi:conjugative transposon TraM protein